MGVRLPSAKTKGDIKIMTELDKLKRAQMYMDQLAEGIDPIDGAALPEDTILNNVRLSRCFFYVSDILRQVIENGGVVGGKKPKKVLLPFALPNELRDSIEITSSPVMIKHFTDKINSFIDQDVMQKLKVTAVTAWLLSSGFLYEEIVTDKKRKRPTKSGEALGITSEFREGQYGGYLAVLYDETAQRHIVSNLDQIISVSNGE